MEQICSKTIIPNSDSATEHLNAKIISSQFFVHLSRFNVSHATTDLFAAYDIAIQHPSLLLADVAASFSDSLLQMDEHQKALAVMDSSFKTYHICHPNYVVAASRVVHIMEANEEPISISVAHPALNVLIDFWKEYSTRSDQSLHSDMSIVNQILELDVTENVYLKLWALQLAAAVCYKAYSHFLNSDDSLNEEMPHYVTKILQLWCACLCTCEKESIFCLVTEFPMNGCGSCFVVRGYLFHSLVAMHVECALARKEKCNQELLLQCAKHY